MSDTGAAQRLVTELKVSGHLMTLDTGLFCVFHTPGSQSVDAATGLPGVRLSPPPQGPSDALSISTFRNDGWLGGRDSAALIRVSQGPAQVLVTVYQMPDGRHEAPRLQVLRLSEGDAVPAASPALAPAQGSPARQAQAPVPSQPAVQAQPSPQVHPPQVQAQPRPPQPSPVPETPPARPPVPQPGGQGTTPGGAQGVSPEVAEVAAHVQGRGDVLCRLGEWMGDRASGRWVEGFAIAPRGPVGREDIEYQAVLGRGWLSPWAEGGQFCGSRGMALPILGLRVRLRGEKAQHFACRVLASFVDGSASGPVEDGEACEAESLAPLEAFVVELVPATHRADRGRPGPHPGPHQEERAEPRQAQREGVRREMAYAAAREKPSRSRAAPSYTVPSRAAPSRAVSSSRTAPAKPAPSRARATPAALAKPPARAAAKPAPRVAAKPPARSAPAKPGPAKPGPGKGKPPRSRR